MFIGRTGASATDAIETPSPFFTVQRVMPGSLPTGPGLRPAANRAALATDGEIEDYYAKSRKAGLTNAQIDKDFIDIMCSSKC